MVPQLPTELKINIIERVSKSSLPAVHVSRANSSFREITEPGLYSVVTLSPFTQQVKLPKVVVGCFRTMMARPSVAAAVRRLHVYLRCDIQPDHNVIGEVFEALGGDLAKLVNLERLELAGWDNRGGFPTRLPRGCPLQSLQHYYGPPEVVDNIQSKVLVTLRLVAYRPEATETSHALLAASRSCSGTLRALDIGRDERDYDEEWLEIVPQISSLFPNVRFLDLGHWSAVDEKLIDELIPSLASPESLRLLQIGEGWVIAPEREGQLVKRLHEGCPQLRAISLQTGVWCFDKDLRKWEQPFDYYMYSEETESKSHYQRYTVRSPNGNVLPSDG